MLAKAAKNPYSDRQLVKIALNIIRNKNDFENGQAYWYVRTPNKHTWEDFMTHFEAALRQLQKNRGDTMQIVAYHKENLLQAETTQQMLG